MLAAEMHFSHMCVTTNESLERRKVVQYKSYYYEHLLPLPGKHQDSKVSMYVFGTLPLIIKTI